MAACPGGGLSSGGGVFSRWAWGSGAAGAAGLYAATGGGGGGEIYPLEAALTPVRGEGCCCGGGGGKDCEFEILAALLLP